MKMLIIEFKKVLPSALLFVLRTIIQSRQQLSKVIFWSGLSLSWESDWRLRLTLFFTSLRKEKIKNLTVVTLCEETHSNTLRLPTWRGEARPRRCWFHLWRWFHRTEHRTPARAENCGIRIINRLLNKRDEKLNTPWPTSLPAGRWHSCPLDAALGGPPCFQRHTSGFCPLWSPVEEQRKLKQVQPRHSGQGVGVTRVTFTQLPGPDPPTLWHWESCSLKWRRRGAGLRELSGNKTWQCYETWKRNNHFIGERWCNLSPRCLSFTSPVLPCPISAGWSSPHPQACSSFGNQHLNKKIKVSDPWQHQ